MLHSVCADRPPLPACSSSNLTAGTWPYLWQHFTQYRCSPSITAAKKHRDRLQWPISSIPLTDGKSISATASTSPQSRALTLCTQQSSAGTEAFCEPVFDATIHLPGAGTTVLSATSSAAHAAFCRAAITAPRRWTGPYAICDRMRHCKCCWECARIRPDECRQNSISYGCRLHMPALHHTWLYCERCRK